MPIRGTKGAQGAINCLFESLKMGELPGGDHLIKAALAGKQLPAPETYGLQAVYWFRFGLGLKPDALGDGTPQYPDM